MKYGCDKCNKVFNRLLLAKRQARTRTRTRTKPRTQTKPCLSVTPSQGKPVPARVTPVPTPLMCVVSSQRRRGECTRGVATMANSVGGHYSRSMLNKFKCLFCKYVNGITDGQMAEEEQKRMHRERE